MDISILLPLQDFRKRANSILADFFSKLSSSVS